MNEFLKYLFFKYWNDMDSVIAGYRSSVIFAWIMIIFIVLVFINLV